MVALIAEGGNAAEVAAATTRAALDGLERGKGDPGVARVFFLLARTMYAAKADGFARALAPLGIAVPNDPSLFDLTGGFSHALDAWHAARDPRSDVADLAELAALEAMTRVLGEKARSLFPTPQDVLAAAKRQSTEAGFRGLAHEFFAAFVRRFLLYHLGREMPFHVGSNGRFADRASHRQFLDALDAHSREAALITKTFAKEWYGKYGWRDGISEPRAAGFTASCLKKLGDELARRGGRHG